MTLNLTQVHLGPGLEETADITFGTVAKCRRAFNAFDFHSVVTRAVCYLHMDFSSLSKLPQGTWNGFLDLTNLCLAFQNCGYCSVSSCSVCNLPRCADFCFQSSFPCFVPIAPSSRITTKTQGIRGLPVRPRHCRSRFEPGGLRLAVLKSFSPVDIAPFIAPSTTRVFSSQLA